MPDHDDLDRRLRAYEAHLPDAEPPRPTERDRRRRIVPIATLGAVSAVLVVVFLVGRFNQPSGEASANPSTIASIPQHSSEPSPSELSGDWGPLAVVDATGDLARNEGELTITADCTFLDRGGLRWLLVWPTDRTRWNAQGETATFTTLSGSDLTFGSGDYLVVGGGGASTGEDGMIPQERVATIEWVQRPRDECLVDSWWFVTDVSSIGLPSPTPEPRPAAWVPLPMPERDASFRSVNDVIEWQGTLVAVGSAGTPDGAIWTSGDGSTWDRATTPAAPAGMGVSLHGPFVVGDRLFAFGTTFHPAGSGPIGSVLWTSANGETWTDTAASAQFEGSPLDVVGVNGLTVVAAEAHETPAGSAFWVSGDGGLTWERSGYDLDSAWATDGLFHQGTFVAVGATFGEGPSDSTASVWTSDDRLTWERTDLGPGRAVRIAELRDGSLLIVGDDEDQPMGWTSSDGRSWARSVVDLGCCGSEFVITPSGFVAVQGAADGSGSVVYASSDGVTWSAAGPLAGEMRNVTWTEAFGVVISGLDPEGRPAIIVGWESE